MGAKVLLLLALMALTTAVPLGKNENVKARYDNYKVYRVIPTTDEHIRKLNEIESAVNEISFWRSATHKGKPADVMVPPHKLSEAHNFFHNLELKYEVMVEDVQKLVEKVHPNQPRATAGFDWEDYHSLDVINNWLDELAAQYPDRISVVIGGQTYENRQIKGVKYSAGGSGKPVIFMDAAVHACEWVTAAVTTFLLNEVLTSQDADVRELVDYFDWYFFPVINPDGYEYTHTTDRLWKKTRRINDNSTCIGVEANRNWGYHWSTIGASDDPCSEFYHGTKPFSEIETSSLAKFIENISDDLLLYINFHSYSQVVLYPMGYTNVPIPDRDNLFAIGNRAAKALQTRYDTVFEVGNMVDILSAGSGSSIDWIKGTFNTTLTFVFELRDTGKYGFLLPPSQIIPSGEEMYDAMMSLLKDAHEQHIRKD